MTASWSSISAAGIASGATNIVVNQPSGVVSGGLYIAYCSSNSTATTFTTPGGETWFGPLGTSSTGCQVYWRLTTGSEPSTETFVRNNTTGNGGVVLLYYTPGTFDSTTPIADCTSVAQSLSTNVVLPSATPTQANTLLSQVIMSTATSAATPWTPPGTATQRANGNGTGTALPYVYGDEVVGSGATGTRTWTHANSTAMRGATIAINPAPASSAEVATKVVSQYGGYY